MAQLSLSLGFDGFGGTVEFGGGFKRGGAPEGNRRDGVTEGVALIFELLNCCIVVVWNES